MSRIRSKDTKPEKVVRSYLHHLGFRFRINKKDLPGKPDIVLKKYKTVIFVHGCFWHQCPNCKRGARIPKSNVEYWSAKLNKNVERDRLHQNNLQKLGWIVLVVWECQTRDESILEDCLADLLYQKK